MVSMVFVNRSTVLEKLRAKGWTLALCLSYRESGLSGNVKEIKSVRKITDGPR